MLTILPAEQEILIQAYYLTSPEIITAPVEKQNPVVTMEVGMNNSQLG
jgi:hypothetical protein